MVQSIMTVCGPINPASLGITLPHEHILIDLRSYCKSSNEDSVNFSLHQSPVKLSNRGEIIQNAFNFIENMNHLDLDDAIDELNEFKNA